jgi:hypothetical protein
MKKNIVDAIFCVLLMIVFTSSAATQWTKTNWPAGNNFFSLYSNQNKVFARTWDSLNGGRTFITADNGATWTPISSSDSSIGILSVVMTNAIIAGTWNGFYQSTSDGANWNVGAPTGIPTNTVIWSLAMLANSLFAGTKGSIYKSADSGTTWTEVKSGIPANARIRSFAAIGSAIFAGSDSVGVFLTTDAGISWTAVNSGLTDKRIFQLAAMGTKVFAVTLSDVFISGNNGTTWTASGPGLKNINCLLPASDQLFAGTDSSGVFASADGAVWTLFGTGMPSGTRVWSLTAGNDHIFAATGSGIWRAPCSINTSIRSVPNPRLHLARKNGSRLTIAFALSGPQTIDIDLYDLCGGKIASLIHERYGAGAHTLSCTTGLIAPGSYIVRLTAGMTVFHATAVIQR